MDNKDKLVKKVLTDLNNIYEEIPVSIDEFIENPKYLGGTLNYGKALYPKWRYHLRKIFEDPYKYSEVVFTGSIGIGKSTVAIVIAAFLLYRLMCIKDPHKFFGIGATQSNIVFLFFNTTMTKAYKSLLGNLYGHLLKSPWFMERGHEAGDRYRTYVPNKNITFEVGSEEQHATSLDIFLFLFDEANDFLHQNADMNQTDAMKILNAANQRIRSRFKSTDRKIFFGKSLILSSKQSELAFLEQYVKDRMSKNPDGIYIVDEPQWNILPLELCGKTFNVAYGNKNAKSRILAANENIDELKKQGFDILKVPIEYKKDFDDNLNRALTEMGGVSVSYIDKFFSREYVRNAFDATLQNPFSTDILIVGLNDTHTEYKDYFDANKIPKAWQQEQIYMHIDTSKSKDRTGISAVSQSKDNPQEIHHLFTIYIQAPKNDQICFAKHENFIFYLYDQLHWDIKDVSSDGYNSDQLKQNIILHGINASYVTADGPNNKTYPTLQRLLYDNLMKLIYIPLLEKELVELDMTTLKNIIDHPFNGSKDGSDSLACAVQNLVNHRIVDEKETAKIDTKELENDLMHSFSKDYNGYNGYNYEQQYSNNYNNNVKKVDLNKIMSNIQQQNNNNTQQQQQNNNYIEDQNFVYYQQQQQENNTETEDSVDMEYFRYD
nr:MAG TPA: terminase [Caudoviricetes sp.]